MFRFAVEVEVERNGGRIMARAQLAQHLHELLDNMDPGEVLDGSTYVVTNWRVELER